MIGHECQVTSDEFTHSPLATRHSYRGALPLTPPPPPPVSWPWKAMRAATRPALTMPLKSAVRDAENWRVPASVIKARDTRIRSPFQLVSSPSRRLTVDNATT